MEKFITNVINNNYNSLIRKSRCSKTQAQTLKKLGTQILKTGKSVLHHLKDNSNKSAKKQGERFGTMLEKVDLQKIVNDKILSRFLKTMTNDTVIAYDLTDEIHKYADTRKQGMENISKVFDGSERSAKNGFFVHGVGTDTFLLRLDPHNSGKNTLPQVRKEILEELILKFKGKGIFAFDRGNDSKVLFRFCYDTNLKFLVRLQQKRSLCLIKTGEELSVEKLPLGRFEVYIKNSKNEKYDTKRKYWVIKKQPFLDKDPISILFSENLINYSDKELIKKYLERWGIENQFRRIKTIYNYESMLVRKWNRRKNLTAIILFSHFLSKIIQIKFEKEKNKTDSSFFIAQHELKIFLNSLSKDYNDYSFVDFLRKKIPDNLAFFLRVKIQNNLSFNNLTLFPI